MFQRAPPRSVDYDSEHHRLWHFSSVMLTRESCHSVVLGFSSSTSVMRDKMLRRTRFRRSLLPSGQVRPALAGDRVAPLARSSILAGPVAPPSDAGIPTGTSGCGSASLMGSSSAAHRNRVFACATPVSSTVQVERVVKPPNARPLSATNRRCALFG